MCANYQFEFQTVGRRNLFNQIDQFFFVIYNNFGKNSQARNKFVLPYARRHTKKYATQKQATKACFCFDFLRITDSNSA
jgi:hypothetical protein